MPSKWAKPPKPGDTLESAIWLSGYETDRQIEEHKANVHGAVIQAWPRLKIKLTPFRHITKHPGDERVPSVPDNVCGPNITLLVSEADVISIEPYTEDNSFVGQLDKIDLARLRELTREQYHGPGHLADWQCDHIIETLGPETAARTIKAAVNLRRVN